MSNRNLSEIFLQELVNSKLLEKLEKLEQLELENLALRLRLSKISVALEYFQRTGDPVFLEITRMYL